MSLFVFTFRAYAFYHVVDGAWCKLSRNFNLGNMSGREAECGVALLAVEMYMHVCN